ncbi:uncharacterized protein RSE6_03255 [Rhynchosporium secalis]|uniref:Phosphoglycerate mutase family protein n=1 Tax=Rhynchosporium secalis TaxID=38038 RepID=A0A1E1M2B4_RHYSE|nr:uncharacterized protein RSE6_03255 [Rhynchosporium secalis]
MAKITIHCVRHAQGFHNLNLDNHKIRDPLLTPFGKSQCESLRQSFPSPGKITHLVASPLRRTIYTTLLSFPAAVQRGLKITALPELQETSNLPCDTGLDLKDLEAEFSEGEYAGTVDLSRVGEDWNTKEGKWSPEAHHIENRARHARLFLRELAEQSLKTNPEQDVEIVVVTHGGYLHYFTEDWTGAGKFVGTGWTNTEVRSYGFVEGDRKGAGLKETRESRIGRIGSEKELGKEEQRTLRDAMEREWSASGYQAKRDETEGESAKL